VDERGEQEQFASNVRYIYHQEQIREIVVLYYSLLERGN
jgi:hypothetical protein